MKRTFEFLREEVRKPLEALKKTAILSVKFLALSLLRLVIWAFFFLFPILVFFLFTFHWVTDKARSGLEGGNLPRAADTTASINNDLQSIPFGLRTLARDIRFWARELERLKR